MAWAFLWTPGISIEAFLVEVMKDEFDIVVIGGGLAGVGFALAAAESGNEVLLVDRRPALGWESTWAGQLDFSGARSPLVLEILKELRRAGGLEDGVADGPIVEMALDRLVRRAGVQVLLYSYPVRLVFERETALGVVICNRSGERLVRGRVIVDATEDALLWTQTETKREVEDSVPGRFSFFMNMVEPGLDLPVELGDGIVLHPTPWGREVQVEYEVRDVDPIAARRAMPDVIRRVREVEQLADALVSHTCNEAFPSSPRVRFEERGPVHPRIHNLFGCGIWSTEAENSPVSRLTLGERVARMAAGRRTSGDLKRKVRTGSISSGPEESSEILIVGGGTAGAVAAIAAARSGASTTLIEDQLSLGGVGTSGAIHNYYYGVTGGIQDEIDNRVAELNPLFLGKWDVRGFHPEVKKQVLLEMAVEAGVDIRLGSLVVGVLLEGEGAQLGPERDKGLVPREDRAGHDRHRLEGVLTVSRGGVRVHQAEVTIDCTGDGDIAAMAGAPFMLGREKDNICHTYSQPAGRLDRGKGALGHYNFDAGYLDPTDVEDVTRARRYGIQLYWREPFDEDTRILYLAPLLGVRQGRQILGEYQLTLADLVAGRRFEDAISFAEAHYDNHGYDYENESEQSAFWVWVLGNWKTKIGCEVPYRCLLPRKVDGLLVASRALSLSYDAHACFRMQRDLQRIGEVAALAAVQAIGDGVSPREIEVTRLQATLKGMGLLEDRHRPSPAISEGDVPRLPDPDVLDPDMANGIAWLALSDRKTGIAALQTAIESKDRDVRYKASAALALLGSSDGVPALLDHLESRDESVPDGIRTVPLWQAAIPFLGKAGDRRAVPALIDVLGDDRAPLDAVIAAARALGEIGGRNALEGLRHLVRRGYPNTERTLRTTRGVEGAVEDARWQLDLSIAEAMARAGAPRKEAEALAAPYLQDDRAYVRRYAGRVLREAGAEVGL